MADETVRIVNLTNEAEAPASGDYLVMDNPTGGTKKILAAKLLAAAPDPEGYSELTEDVSELKSDFGNMGLSVVDGALNVSYTAS